MKKNRRPLMVAFSALGLAALTACGGSKLLSEVPKPGSTLAAPMQQTSTLNAQVVVPFTTLMETANSSAPKAFSESGRERTCQRIGPKGRVFGARFDWTTNVCADVNYTVNVSRGDITIVPGPQPGSLRVAVPINFDGSAGFSGDLARMVSLHRKNFRGAISAWVDLKVDVGEDWCPKLDGEATYNWITPARIEVLPNAWVRVDSLVDGELRSELAKLTKAMNGAIDCQEVRKEVAKAWSVRSVELPAFSGFQANLSVEPVSVGFSGVKVFSDRVELGFQTTANVVVSDRASEQKELALPALRRVEHTAGRLQLATPLKVTYESINQALNDGLRGKDFSSNTPAGKVTAKVLGLNVYSSGEDLVVGVRFKAAVPGRWLDVSGEVYLYGQPAVDSSGQVVSIDNLRFSRILDHQLWALVSAVFEKEIRETISKQARFEVGPLLESAKEMLDEQLRELHSREGVSITLGGPTISVRQLVPAENELVVEALFESGAVIELSGKRAEP